MRETENCALKLAIFYLGTSFVGYCSLHQVQWNKNAIKTCHLCPNITTNPTITGANGVPIKIFGNFSCNSSNIIYAISCNLCPKAIYIGETSNSIRQRMNGHRSDIKHNRNTPVAEHFNKPDHI